AFHKRLSLEEAVSEDRVIDSMRRIERGDFGKALQVLTGKVNRDVRKPNRAIPGRGEEHLFQPIGLALHAIDQHAPDLGTVDSPPLKYMPGTRAASIVGVSRREDLVPLAANRLQVLATAQSRDTA